MPCSSWSQLIGASWLTCPVLGLLGLYLIRSGANGFLLTSNIGRGLVGFFIGAMLAQRVGAGLSREIRVLSLCVLLVFATTVSMAGLKAFPWGEGGINLTFSLAIFPSVLGLSLTVPWLSRLLSVRPPSSATSPMRST